VRSTRSCDRATVSSDSVDCSGSGRLLSGEGPRSVDGRFVPGPKSRSGMVMMRRMAAALALIPSIVCAQLLPATHLHRSDGEHTHAVVHRHFAEHDTNDGAEFDDRDSSAIWLGDAAFEVATTTFVPQVAVTPSTFELVSIRGLLGLASLDDAAPPHGPPRSRIPARAPPASLL
jgi:hypothetical protein